MRVLEMVLDWRLRKVLRDGELPDLPEVRRWARALWMNGFCGWPGDRALALYRLEARAAAVRYELEKMRRG
jgi:hypothetical protein